MKTAIQFQITSQFIIEGFIFTFKYKSCLKENLQINKVVVLNEISGSDNSRNVDSSHL